MAQGAGCRRPGRRWREARVKGKRQGAGGRSIEPHRCDGFFRPIGGLKPEVSPQVGAESGSIGGLPPAMPPATGPGIVTTARPWATKAGRRYSSLARGVRIDTRV